MGIMVLAEKQRLPIVAQVIEPNKMSGSIEVRCFSPSIDWSPPPIDWSPPPIALISDEPEPGPVAEEPMDLTEEQKFSLFEWEDD